MDDQLLSSGYDLYSQSLDDAMDVRKGPWTSEEDEILSHYVAMHGEGRWNAVACSSGLKRTGKSCRLRWLNYLRPDVRRGNITLKEQLLILELHSRWGNRWSKIAQYLPGRTDNEIKNYWRTRVQKQAKQLNCDVNSKEFRDAMRHVWMPRIMERIKAAESNSDHPYSSSTNIRAEYGGVSDQILQNNEPGLGRSEPSLMRVEQSRSSSDSWDSQGSGNTTSSGINEAPSGDGKPYEGGDWDWYGQQGREELMESFWYDENIMFLQQQLL